MVSIAFELFIQEGEVERGKDKRKEWIDVKPLYKHILTFRHTTKYTTP